MKKQIVVTQSEDSPESWWAEFRIYENKRHWIKEGASGGSAVEAAERLKMVKQGLTIFGCPVYIDEEVPEGMIILAPSGYYDKRHKR